MMMETKLTIRALTTVVMIALTLLVGCSDTADKEFYAGPVADATHCGSDPPVVGAPVSFCLEKCGAPSAA